MSILVAIWSFVSQPSVYIPLGAAAGWLWSKLRGEKVDSWSTIVREVGVSLATEAIHTWVPGGTVADGMAYVRGYVEERIWSVLTKRGVPRNALTEPIVHAIVESSTNEVTHLIEQQLAPALLPQQLQQLADRALAVKDAFKVDPSSKLATVSAELRSMADVEVTQPK